MYIIQHFVRIQLFKSSEHYLHRHYTDTATVNKTNRPIAVTQLFIIDSSLYSSMSCSHGERLTECKQEDGLLTSK